MVTYIYFVKCPNCEDEHFDFFDDAKTYAMGCISEKPIITQTEVCRNDFGECTDSTDLGTVWSWEDMMGDLDKEDTKFSKAETFGISEGINDFDDFDIGPQSDEFADLDNSVDFEVEEDELPLEECIHEQLTEATTAEIDEIFKLCKEIGIITGTDLKAFINEVGVNGNLLDELREYRAELSPEFKIKECTERKPVPEGMTIEQLIETMEENEETVECTVCEELFPKADGVKQGHGYICPTCKAETAEDSEVEDVDLDPFNQDYPDVEPEEDAEIEEAEYAPSKTEVGRAVADLVVDEFDAVGGYEMVAEVVKDSEVAAEKQEEILATLDHIKDEEVEHIEELKELTLEDKEEALVKEDEVLEEDVSEEMIQCAGCEQMFPKDECFEKEGIGCLCGDCEDRIVKCTWCDELYDRGECRYEVDLGWLCDRCEAAIKSRGETLTFREGNYWDFLDEETEMTAELKKEATLTEAAYANIKNLPDVKNQILDLAKLEGRALKYINNDNTINPAKAEANSDLGYITDFNLNEAGEIIVTLDRGNGRSNNLELDNLMNGGFFTRGLRRDCAAHGLLTAIRNAAKILNKRIGAVGARNLNVDAELRNHPNVASELKNHITRIKFRIPIVNEIIDLEDVNGEPLTSEAETKLNNLYSNFFAIDFAEDAYEAGMVDNRLPTEDTNKNIASSWKPIGKITFDCKVRDLSAEAQQLIKVSRPTTDKDVSEQREIDCVRLAIALIKYFKDVKFYESDIEVTEDDFFNQEF